MQKKAYYSITLLIGISVAIAQANPASQLFNIAMSTAFFHQSIRRPFNFNVIACDTCSVKPVHGLFVTRDAHGNITSLNDAKRPLLVLGSIPRSEEDLEQLITDFNVPDEIGIEILSMNRTFELNWAGILHIFHKKSRYALYRYPTTDHTAPTLIDLIRVTRDIKHRDERLQGLTYVHCRAGKGRSATAVVAYLYCILFEAGFEVTIHQVEHYLKLRRPQIHMNSDQKKMLELFAQELKKAGSLDELCNQHKKAIAARDSKHAVLL